MAPGDIAKMNSTGGSQLQFKSNSRQIAIVGRRGSLLTTNSCQLNRVTPVAPVIH